MGRTLPHVTDAELAVLQLLWDRGPSPVRRVADALYPGGGPSEYRGGVRGAGAAGGGGVAPGAAAGAGAHALAAGAAQAADPAAGPVLAVVAGRRRGDPGRRRAEPATPGGAGRPGLRRRG